MIIVTFEEMRVSNLNHCSNRTHYTEQAFPTLPQTSLPSQLPFLSPTVNVVFGEFAKLYIAHHQKTPQLLTCKPPSITDTLCFSW